MIPRILHSSRISGGRATDMSQRYQIHRLYGLKTRLAAAILAAALISSAFFGVLIFLKDYLIGIYFDDPAVESGLTAKYVDDLQNYVDKNHISTGDLSRLKEWEDRQPLILLELYTDKDLVYSSYYNNDGVIEEYLSDNTDLSDRNNIYTIEFSDKNLLALIYMDVTYRYYYIGNAVAFVIAVILFILLYIHSNRKLIKYILRLGDDVQILEGGNLDYEVTVAGNDELTDLAKSMNRMRKAFRNQLITEQELRQASSKLISEMSHDLRTPLTALMLYTEILKSDKYNGEAELKEYIDKIDAKAALIKQLSDNIFEYAIDNRKSSNTAAMDLEDVLPSLTGEITESLKTAGFTVQTDTIWQPMKIRIRKELLDRITENIVSNILKYADRDVDVYIETVYQQCYCGLSFINSVDRNNDVSDSHGIGLESVRTMMKLMDGICTVEQTGDAFELTLFFLIE